MAKDNTEGCSSADKNEKINSLVQAVKSNDTASFLELLGIYSRTIVTLASSFSLPESEKEDLCQEGRMALYRAALSYDKSTAKFSTYAVVCMTNAMISFSKKYNADSNARVYGIEPEQLEAISTTTDMVSDIELDELLMSENGGIFSQYERKVLALKLSGYKVSEIAKSLGKSSKSVENTLFRARKKLKEHLNI